ncbi:MAG: 50S ribosomal protein L23 [Anaerolineae bacterium]|nr:50S ribosomal protein L23 [Anaerolineae bacterium]MCK6577534.1 50S ribosomal protein L23 [Anaerolineae bacterium]NUQ03618.1 50S ribosomal protein L23 [Anaerolineae bacterium]
MALHLYDVILRPVVTEKSNIMTDENGQYVFEVHPDANKQQIREAVETIFEKRVKKVNTMIMPAKRGFRGRRTYMRSKQWKKAVVTLEAGERIELFEV